MNDFVRKQDGDTNMKDDFTHLQTGTEENGADDFVHLQTCTEEENGANDFVHLHVHTEYSLLDGACDIEKLLDRAGELGMKSLAITDHGSDVRRH